MSAVRCDAACYAASPGLPRHCQKLDHEHVPGWNATLALPGTTTVSGSATGSDLATSTLGMLTMSTTLKSRIAGDMKSAMKAGDKDRLKVLRLLLADIQRVEVDTRKELDEPGTLAVVEKAVKQRRDAIEQFTKGGRQDLVDVEQAELEVVQSYLPTRLSAAELDALVADVIRDTGAEGVRDMGKVMAGIRERAAGRADMAAVSALVKSRLA